MTREEIECLGSYVKTLNQSGGCNFALIKHTNKIRLIKEEIKEVVCDEYGDRIFYHCFEENKMNEAYDPFFEIIKQLLSDSNVDMEEFIKSSGVYSLHIEVFRSYFETGRCIRLEEPFFSEVEFERDKILQGIVGMLKKAADGRKVLIVINRLNYAGASTIDLLNSILLDGCSNINIVAFENENGKVRIHEEAYKEKFVQSCEDKNCVYDWPINSGVVENVLENGFVFNGSSMEEYLTIAHNMFCMFAYDEMRYYLDYIYQKVQIENVGITRDLEIRLYKQLAILSVLQGDCSHALLVAENMHQLNDTLNDWKISYDYECIIANVNMHNGNINAALEAADKATWLAKTHHDKYLEFKAKMTKIVGKFSGFHNFLISYENYPVSEEFLAQCVEYKHYNHLAHLYVYCFENDMFDTVTMDNIDYSIPMFTKGIEIGEELGNDQFLTEAYRSVIMLASYSGKRELVIYFYEKDIQIAKRGGNRFEEAMVYNGLGYNHCAAEDYKNANYYFNLAMKIFHQLGLSDYIIETFYNMSINAIMAEEYDNATTYLEKTLYLLNINRKNSLRVCNISKVIGLIALSSFYQGRIHSTRNYLVTDGQFLDYTTEKDYDDNNRYLWDDDLFLYHICHALLCNYSGKYEEALKIYDKAEVYMERSQGNYFFAYPQFCIAKQYTLEKLGKLSERMELLQAYKKFCNKNAYLKHLQVAKKLIDGTYEENNTIKDTLKCPIMNEVCEAERRRCIERDAGARRKEIQFFSLFQNLLDRHEDNLSDKMNSVLSALASNYNLDGVVTIHIADDGERTVYREKAKEMSKENIDLVVKFFEEKKNGFAVSKYNGNYKDYRRLFSVMFGGKIFSMVGVPVFENERLSAVFVAYTVSRENWNASTDRYVLNDYDREIYTFLFRQIINAMKKWQAQNEIERMNKLLKKQAVTDELTGLLNRQGYYTYVKSVLKRENAAVEKYAFVYLDLDHFKYYNDTFGHHVGDAILISFANIFRRMAPEGAKVIRLGGDEFAIILRYENRNEVVDMSRNILAEIEKAKGFGDVVEHIAFKSVTLEEDSYAGCSIGIAYLDGVRSEEDFETAQNNADAALYYVKEHGRNSYMEFKN